jgi:hypothetical protein
LLGVEVGKFIRRGEVCRVPRRKPLRVCLGTVKPPKPPKPEPWEKKMAAAKALKQRGGTRLPKVEVTPDAAK